MQRTLSFSIAAAWLAAVSAAYYLLYPFPALLTGLPRITPVHFPIPSLAPLFLLFLILAAANGWGSFFWRRTDISRLERLVFATGAGMGIMSLLVLVLAAFGLLRGRLSLAVPLAGLVLFLFALLTGRIRLRLTEDFRAAALLALLPLAGTLLGALAPPTQFDSLVYHLSLPARYLAHGGMYAVPQCIFFAFPQNAEMLFQLGMKINGDILANLIAWSFFPLTGLAIYALSRRFWGFAVALAAACFWLFTPAIAFLATGTYVDLSLAYYAFACVYGLILGAQTGSRSWILAAGFFGGLALGTKYTAAAAIFPALLLVPVLSPPRRALADTLIFLGAVLALFAPWLIRNWIFLHNPIAPWGTAVFGRSLVSPGVAAGYFTHIGGHGIPVANISAVFSLPWDLTANGFRYGGGFDLPGPVFLLFIPVLFFTLKIDKITGVLLAVAAVYFAAWLYTGKVLRFLVPIVPFFCIFAAQGFARCSSTRWLKYAALTALILALTHNLLLFHWTMAPVDPYAVVLGGVTRDEYLSRKLDYYPAARTALSALPPGSKVLAWGETRNYYCPSNTVTPTIFDAHPLAEWANASGSYREFASMLRANGFTHILVNGREAERLGLEGRLTPAGKETRDRFLSQCTRTSYQDPYCRLYEIAY